MDLEEGDRGGEDRHDRHADRCHLDLPPDLPRLGLRRGGRVEALLEDHKEDEVGDGGKEEVDGRPSCPKDKEEGEGLAREGVSCEERAWGVDF